MSMTDRCDEIIRLIDEALGESKAEVVPLRRPGQTWTTPKTPASASTSARG